MSHPDGRPLPSDAQFDAYLAEVVERRWLAPCRMTVDLCLGEYAQYGQGLCLFTPAVCVLPLLSAIVWLLRLCERRKTKAE